VKREIIASMAFNRRVRRLAKRQPVVAAGIHATLLQLAADAFQAQLKNSQTGPQMGRLVVMQRGL
jgi:hypothetical protein